MRHLQSLLVAAVLAAVCWPGAGIRAADAGAGAVGVVCNVKVVSDKVPDVSSLEAWKKSFIKDGMTDQQKALAIWKSVAVFQYQSGAAPVEYVHHEDGMYDPIKMFNVYGYGICCYAAAHVEALGRYIGFGARGWGIKNHSVPELQYDNAWHLLDASLLGYFPKEDGKIASIAELKDAIQDWYKANPEYADAQGNGNDAKLRAFQHGDGNTAWKTKGPALIARAPNYDQNGWWPAGTHGWYSTMQEFDGNYGNGKKAFIYEYGASQGYQVNIQLRPGEKLVRNWGNVGKHIQMDGKGTPGCMDNKDKFFTNAEAFAATLDPALKSYGNGRVGNGTYEYDVPLASGVFKTGALLADNLAAKAEDNAAPAVHLKDAAKPGQLVIRMPSSYVYLSGTVTGKAVVGTGGDITVELSQNNGLDWKELQKITSTSDLNVDLKEFVYRRYDYRLRFTFKGQGTGLDALKITHDVQHSQRVLPALDRGDNKITFSAGAQESTITLEANSQLGKHTGKQIEYTEYHPDVEGFEENCLKLNGGQQGTLTLPVTVPGEMTRLRFGCHYRTWGDEDCMEYQVSFDGGKTFKHVGDGPAQKFGRTAYCTVTDVPPGTQKALVRFIGKRKTSMMIWGFRIDADYKAPNFGFRPVKVTYTWTEMGEEKKDEHIAKSPDETYTIKCAAKPTMKSITLELAQ